mgnify:CR=1 FL=1
MRVKTCELAGQALDWAVSVVELDVLREGGHPVKPWVEEAIREGRAVNAYSTDWLWAGEIIEREGIELARSSMSRWQATIDNVEGDALVVTETGDTPLVAAMRCWVSYAMGDSVDVPDAVASTSTSAPMQSSAALRERPAAN